MDLEKCKSKRSLMWVRPILSRGGSLHSILHKQNAFGVF